MIIWFITIFSYSYYFLKHFLNVKIVQKSFLKENSKLNFGVFGLLFYFFFVWDLTTSICTQRIKSFVQNSFLKQKYFFILETKLFQLNLKIFPYFILNKFLEIFNNDPRKLKRD